MTRDIRSDIVAEELKLNNAFIVLTEQGYVVNAKKKDKLNCLIILQNIFTKLIPINSEQKSNSIVLYNKVINL